MNKISFIIARYNEDLEWTITEPFNKYKYIVYNKGSNENFNKTNIEKIINLENVGRESHTYLYHVINNYDNLDDAIIFLSGSLDKTNELAPFNKNIIGKKLISLIESEDRAVFYGFETDDLKKKFYDFKLDNWGSSYNPNNQLNGEIKLFPSDPRPYGIWFSKHFGDINVRNYCFCGIFSIDKRDIIQHSLAYYKCLIKDLEVHSNPEVGHYFERSWAAVFHPLKYTEFKLF